MPWMPDRFSGEEKLRKADRQFAAGLFQLPPRATRIAPALCKNRALTIFASIIRVNDKMKEVDGKRLSWCEIEGIVSTMRSNPLKR
jgi:hypothetical protein